MANYLKLSSDGSTVENVLVAEAAIATEWGLVAAPEGVGVGWTMVSGTWTAPTPPAPSAADVAKATAVGTVATLLAGVPARVSQANTDLAALQAISNPSTGIPTAEVLAILVRAIESMLVMTQGLEAIVTAAGL